MTPKISYLYSFKGLDGKTGLSLDTKGLKRREYTNARSKNWLSSSGCLVAEAGGGGRADYVGRMRP